MFANQRVVLILQPSQLHAINSTSSYHCLQTSTVSTAYRPESSPKWPILCWVGR